MKTAHLAHSLASCFLAGSVFLSGEASAYTLSFQPSAQDVGLGSSAKVEVRITDVQPDLLGSLGGLGAYDFDIVYDPAISKFQSATDAEALGTAIGLGIAESVSEGTLKASDFSFEPTAVLLARQSDSMLLFSLYFETLAVGSQTLAVGSSPLLFDNITLGDAEGNLRVGVPPSTTGSITVEQAAVPEPGTLALLAGVGLIALGGRRFRRVCPG